MHNEQQRKTLRLICETLSPRLQSLPALEFDIRSNSECNHSDAIAENSASLYAVDEHLIRRLKTVSWREQAQFGWILWWIELPFLCKSATGFVQPFSSLNQQAREQVLRSWARSNFPAMRRFFQTVKRITLFLCYAAPPVGTSTKGVDANPTWNRIGYDGVNRQQPHTTRLPILQIPPREDTITCDVLVVGSGAGGSVAANNLAKMGRDVLIVEKGGYFESDQLGIGEFEGNRQLFEKLGGMTSRDLAIVILSGSTLGGGTTVNWMTCLDPPIELRQQWATDFGLESLVSDLFSDSLQRIRDRLNTNTTESLHNRQNQILLDGCERLGYRMKLISRNTSGCTDCGFCGYGCRSGAKQDTRQTFLKDAVGFGANIVVNCRIKRLLVKGKRIVGASATIKEPTGERDVTFRCNTAVVAGGAIQTAALMLRSGFKNRNIGRHLHLHPTTAIASFFDEPVNAWQGAPQTVVCDEFADLDQRGYGCRLEVAPMHPGFGAMALAWESAAQHKNWMSNFSRIANTIVITRDRASGRVSLKQGRINVRYRLDRFDGKHLMDGVAGACAIHRAAGAASIVGPHQVPKVFHRGGNFTSFLAAIRRTGTGGNLISLFSAHQMSTCRIGKSPRSAVFDPSGRSYEFDNLFVADTSAFPTSTGVNPMITVMSLVDTLSRNW